MYHCDNSLVRPLRISCATRGTVILLSARTAYVQMPVMESTITCRRRRRRARCTKLIRGRGCVAPSHQPASQPCVPRLPCVRARATQGEATLTPRSRAFVAALHPGGRPHAKRVTGINGRSQLGPSLHAIEEQPTLIPVRTRDSRCLSRPSARGPPCGPNFR